MNQKKAKNLRRIAREITVGKPNVGHIWMKRGIELTHDCTRAVYQKLKRRVQS